MAHRLRLVPDDLNIPFFRHRWPFFIWSALVLVATVVMVAINGMNFGIDFKGGTVIEVQMPGPADLAAMRSTVDGLGLGASELQTAGSDRDVLIRLEASEDQDEQRARVDQVKEALNAAFGEGIVYKRQEFVGPKVSGELLMNGVWAVLISVAGVLVYLWFRFEWQYGVGALAALIHDVSTGVGVYAFTGMEFNLTSIAALLMIVGYSLNDTVVIYDRVRENLRRYKAMPIEQLLDRSINETMARTLATSITTLLALLALFVLGGPVIRDFTVIMIVGVIVGIYSTIYIAAPVLYYLNLRASSPAPAKAGPATAKG
ncbi:MAG TPA: protein translocase subunit SecF [Geminicoccus sp.]|uniref:protein translocase subunit SecF n=1 Tax=Geminicoccus sp. TaxID=2024832 RepID=UPI002C0B1D17|nr:protein translocase subunit SecF [Geminicoccus sp.]HWL68112.1 protein translocase subunit SecF [Geminicoccus sp.]